MPIHNLLPTLAEEPRDIRGDWSATDPAADEIVYRLGFKAAAVSGLPPETTIDDVRVEFVDGPVRAQQTEVRQRHGLPVVFDKVMRRLDVGHAHVVAIFSLRHSPVPANLEQAFGMWRQRALAAAGMLASVLDERVVQEELFEDAVLLRDGTFVGAADMRGRVRTFLPFDVTAADRSAIEQLKGVSLSESSDVARAARLYRRAALEGPTADAYAMLWVAAECFSERRSPSRKEIETALDESGLDPRGLPISVGRLIDLRGKIQHHGVEEDDRLRMAFYEMEAIVRALIRRDMQLRGGWWPASDNPAAFADPFDHAVAALVGPGTTEWHRDRLPPPMTPSAHRLPRRIPNATVDPRVETDERFGGARDLLAGTTVDALEWQDPDASIAIRLGLPPNAPRDATALARATGIWLAPQRVQGLSDPGSASSAIVNLVWDIHSLVAAVLAQRAGIVSDGGAGTTAIEALGAWAQYRRLVTYGEFDSSLLNTPTAHDAIALGKLSGWAAAGDASAKRAAERLNGNAHRLVRTVIDGLLEHRPGAPTDLLAAVSLRP